MSTLRARTKTAYGLGQFAWASKDTCFHFFLFFYYTQFLGLSASLAGLAAMLALIADGISDPLIGQVSDNYKSGRWGRRHPFMAIAILPYCISLLAIFNPPAGLSGAGLFGWYLFFAILVRSFLTLFTVPHMALGAELSEDYDERTSISVYRNFLGYCGGLSIQVIAWFMVIPMATAAGNVADGYRNMGYYAAVLALAGMLIALLGTRRQIPHLPQTAPEQQARRWYFAFHDIVSVLQNRSALVLFLSSLVITTGIGVHNTLLLHINNFFYGFSSEQIGTVMLAVVLALLPSAWLAMQGTHRLGKRNTTITFIVIQALIVPMPILAHLYGLTPPVGSTGLLLLVSGFSLLQQSFYIGSLHSAAAMLPDVADEIDVETGLRKEGTLNSAMMLTQKVTFGMGAFLAGLTIDFAGLGGVTDISQTTPQMIERLAWVYGPGLACVGLLGACVYSLYGLSPQRYASIRAQLNAARA